MRGINKVIIVGNLGNDPEVRALPSGTSVVNFSVATSKSWKDKRTGEQKEKTEWHNIVVFNRVAEIASQYLHKGSKVYLEGEIETRKWEDKSGNPRETKEIRAYELQMLDSKPAAAPAPKPQQQQAEEFPEDDIPF